MTTERGASPLGCSAAEASLQRVCSVHAALGLASAHVPLSRPAQCQVLHSRYRYAQAMLLHRNLYTPQKLQGACPEHRASGRQGGVLTCACKHALLARATQQGAHAGHLHSGESTSLACERRYKMNSEGMRYIGSAVVRAWWQRRGVYWQCMFERRAASARARQQVCARCARVHPGVCRLGGLVL